MRRNSIDDVMDRVDEASRESFPASDSPAWAMDREFEEAGAPVENNKVENRFEVTLDGMTGYLEYHSTRGEIFLKHTEVPTKLEGRGVASALARAALEYARAEKALVVPLCQFVVNYIRRHQEYLDLVRPDYQARSQG